MNDGALNDAERVIINGQTYIVAVLREQDITYLARRIAQELRRGNDEAAERELAAEHRRQAPGFRHESGGSG